GINLQSGGKVVNGAISATQALIESTGLKGLTTYAGSKAYAVNIDGGPASVTNFGTISSPVLPDLLATGGVRIANAIGRVTNFGMIEGGEQGVVLDRGGTVVNGGSGASRALIEGLRFAVDAVGGPGTVINFGTIEGGVELGRNGRLIVEPGAKFTAGVGAAGKDDTIELAAKSSGTLRLDTEFVGFDKVVVDRGADWRIDLGLNDLKATTISGNGRNVLALSDAGTVDLSGARGFPTISLSGAGANMLTLASSNFIGIAGGVITVAGGNAADVLSEAGVPAGDHAVLAGGGGNDTLIAGRNAALRGGAGKDMFELTVPGSPTTPDRNTIADFAPGIDKIAFSEKGFALGKSPDAATLFRAN
ncbi:MAG: M10 family metallopeptidase C-terminal domain-containing protein, partial [Stellaceae bacterium]